MFDCTFMFLALGVFITKREKQIKTINYNNNNVNDNNTNRYRLTPG